MSRSATSLQNGVGHVAWRAPLIDTRYRRGRTFGTLLNSYERAGFGYVGYSEALTERLRIPEYGVSLSSSPWVIGQLQQLSSLRVLLAMERAWGGHDVMRATRRSAEL